MSYLILLRHGQSEWNKKNIFTGWVDIPLSNEGVEQALQAGVAIQHIPIDFIFTSTLIRGVMTAVLAMLKHQSKKVPVILHQGEGQQEEWSKCYDAKSEAELIPLFCAWQLNERMYGELQGKNKKQILEHYGEEQFKLWRRSYAVAPPQGESLKMTADRTLPFFEHNVIPMLSQGKNILISAHGNSLRSIIMKIEKLSEQEVLNLEIPTGLPLFYEYKNGLVNRAKF